MFQRNVPDQSALPSGLVASVGPGPSRKPPMDVAARQCGRYRFGLHAAARAEQTRSSSLAVDQARSCAPVRRGSPPHRTPAEKCGDVACSLVSDRNAQAAQLLIDSVGILSLWAQFFFSFPVAWVLYPGYGCRIFGSSSSSVESNN